MGKVGTELGNVIKLALDKTSIKNKEKVSTKLINHQLLLNCRRSRISAFRPVHSCSDGGFTALNWFNWINLDSKKFGHQIDLRYNFEVWKSINSLFLCLHYSGILAQAVTKYIIGLIWFKWLSTEKPSHDLCDSNCQCTLYRPCIKSFSRQIIGEEESSTNKNHNSTDYRQILQVLKQEERIVFWLVKFLFDRAKT